MSLGKRLHTLGTVAFQHPWRVIAIWIALIAALGGSAAYFIKPTSSELSIPGTDAQVAIDRVNELFQDSGKGSGRIVFHTDSGKISDYRKQIIELGDDVAKIDGVSAVVSPFDASQFISDSGTIAYSQVQLREGNGSIDTATLDRVAKLVEAARVDGLQIEVGGDLINRAPEEILGIGEVGGVLIALLVLVMTLGSLIAAGMPIVVALVAVGVSMAALFSMSELFTINQTTPVLAVMLGLAVGIDYSLFIISKYRSLVLDGYSYKDAAGRAIGTAGNAVIFAALTVVIALAALSVLGIPFISIMGLAGAATVAIAAVISVTLVPALLGVAGHLVFTRRTRKEVAALQKRDTKAAPKLSRKTFWYKWGETLAKYPIVVIVLTIGILGVLALPAKDLTLGLPTDEYAAKDSTQRKAYDLLGEGFGVGFNGPLTVVVEDLPAVTDADRESVRQAGLAEYQAQAAEATTKQEALFAQKAANAVTVEQQLALQQEIMTAKAQGEEQKKRALVKIEQSVDQYAKLVQLSNVANKLAELDNVEQALPAAATSDGTAGIIQLIPRSAPSDQATIDLIQTLRSESDWKNLTGSDTATLAVTGSTALAEDINEKLSNAMPQYLAVVIGLSLILLVLAFRSILVPIKATLGFLLSVLVMFGAIVAVFQWGWFGIAEAPGPIVSFIPIIAIGILFGLAMDYEFFLVSSMHESYSRTKNARRAVVDGFGLGSKVVTAAGVIMVSVFAGFILNHDTTIQTIGFGLAVGILVDAFIVRMMLVPAVMVVLGKSAWWLPRWLDRTLPHVSIEGEADSPSKK